MTKGLISIFALPGEIDNLHTTLYNLRRNASVISHNHQFGIDITLCLSDELTNWKQSLSKTYFEDKFHQMIDTLCDWAILESVQIEYGTNILGCVSQRRHSLQYVDDYDFTLWLDNDLFFNDNFLAYVAMATSALKENDVHNYVITPQITRQWDNTWDILVNEQLLSRQLNDYKVADVFKLGLTTQSNVNLKPIDGFKAAGGWGTVISNTLLKFIGIPNSLGHYGLEDTYVMNCSTILRQFGKHNAPRQYILENVLVCENHKNGTTEYLKNHIHSIDKRKEHLQVARDNFMDEIELFKERVKI